MHALYDGCQMWNPILKLTLGRYHKAGLCYPTPSPKNEHTKKLKQNRPIPNWTRMCTGNSLITKIRTFVLPWNEKILNDPFSTTIMGKIPQNAKSPIFIAMYQINIKMW